MKPMYAEKTFLELIDDLYDEWEEKMPDVEYVDGEPIVVDITIDTVAIAIMHTPGVDPDHFVIHCPFGKLPPSPEATLIRALEMNALTSHNATGVMCINPHTCEMMMVARCALNNVDGQSLTQSLMRIARLAVQWRQNHFLDDKFKTELHDATNEKRSK